MSDTVKTAYQNPPAAQTAALNLSAPNLTRHPPRSPRTRLGGYVHLPRLIDKARAATPPDARAFFNDVHRKNAPQRDDIATWFDWLELDDYVTFGGKP